MRRLYQKQQERNEGPVLTRPSFTSCPSRLRGQEPPRPAVFLDRDGTIIRDVGYLRSVDQIELLPGAAEALRRLRQAGFLLVCVSNQSGVARGYFTEEDVQKSNRALQALLRKDGAELDAIYYSPYLAEGTVARYARESHCRKPGPGMLLRAAGELKINLARSWMVGDKPSDVEAGRRAGCRTIRLGPADAAPPRPESAPDFTAADLPEAAALILREGGPCRVVG